MYAKQLPDPSEPRSDSLSLEFLNTFVRWDWWNNRRDPQPNILQLLYNMNGGQTVLRSFASNPNSPTNRPGRLAQRAWGRDLDGGMCGAAGGDSARRRRAADDGDTVHASGLQEGRRGATRAYLPRA